MSEAPVLAAEPVRARESLLSKPEQAWLGLRLTLSLVAGGCLLISAGLRLAAPSQRDVAELAAGVAALLVAVPALVAAWSSLRHPDLHGVTDQLVALALDRRLGPWRPDNGGASSPGDDRWPRPRRTVPPGLGRGHSCSAATDQDQGEALVARRGGRRGRSASLARRRPHRALPRRRHSGGWPRADGGVQRRAQPRLPVNRFRLRSRPAAVC